tara:strand:+ start:2933 stop:4060 length:1128 start_codon:yes stop_codon:yes gene_type:complete
MPMVKRKQKKVRARARTGIAAAPIDKGYEAVKYYFHMELDRKDLAASLKTYVKRVYSKAESSAILANPDYKFTCFSHYSCIAFWLNSDLPQDEKTEYWENSLKKYLAGLIESGKTYKAEKAAQTKKDDNVITLSPAQRLANKISNTIMQDLLDLEDAWIEGEKAELDVYQQFKKHGLSGSATIPVRKVIEGWALDYEDALHKRCDQAVEGYSHLKRPELKRRLSECNKMLDDLDRIKSAARATRAIKSNNKPRAADKQVAKVKYKKEDTEFKLVSIPPIKIIGSFRIYVFNTKHKSLTEYVTESPSGFEISGTTIKNFGPSSRSTRLRKPLDFLPLVLNKTPNQIDKEWKTLTTKTTTPNGRLNSDTIILRACDK